MLLLIRFRIIWSLSWIHWQLNAHHLSTADPHAHLITSFKLINFFSILFIKFCIFGNGFSVNKMNAMQFHSNILFVLKKNPLWSFYSTLILFIRFQMGKCRRKNFFYSFQRTYMWINFTCTINWLNFLMFGFIHASIWNKNFIPIFQVCDHIHVHIHTCVVSGFFLLLSFMFLTYALCKKYICTYACTYARVQIWLFLFFFIFTFALCGKKAWNIWTFVLIDSNAIN